MLGSVIAVAYEHTNHDDWCDHETTLAIWNINRRDFDPCSPFQQFTVPSCLTIAKFHPRHPGFIVAGGYTGDARYEVKKKIQVPVAFFQIHSALGNMFLVPQPEGL